MAHSSDSWRAGGTGRGAYVLTPQLATQKPLIVQGIAGQTANIFEVQNSSGSTLLSVDSGGNLTIAGSSNVTISESVTGNLSLVGNLSVTGITTLTGAVSLASTLVVGSAATFNTTALFKGIVTLNSALSVAGATTLSSTVSFPDGTLAIPSLTFIADTDTGVFRSSSNAMDLVAGGQTMGRFVNLGGNTGGIRVGLSGTASIPSFSFLASTSTGLHHAGSNTLGIDAGGVQVMTVAASAVSFLKGQKVNVTKTAINYNALATDFYIGVTSTAAARTINLPAAATAGSGACYYIKDESGAASVTNTITIKPSGVELIEGSASKIINTPFVSVTVICDGTKWFII